MPRRKPADKPPKKLRGESRMKQLGRRKLTLWLNPDQYRSLKNLAVENNKPLATWSAWFLVKCARDLLRELELADGRPGMPLDRYS